MIGLDSHGWASYSGPDYPLWPLDYSFDDPNLHAYNNITAPVLPSISSIQFNLPGPTLPKPFQNAKAQPSTYSTSSNRLSSYQRYPCTVSLRPPLASNRRDFNLEGLRVRCPNTDCGKVFKDLKAHMLTHMKERPEKCPIVTCNYHIKGFCRKYDKNRHTLTHYRGTMVCSFCPVSAAKTFNRADVFKRHLLSVHGVEHTPPPTYRKTSNSKAAIPSTKLSEGCLAAAKGICSICLVLFWNPQDFYNHLDDCVISSVLQTVSIPPARIGQKIPIKNATSVNKRTQEPRSLPPVEKVPETGRENNTICYTSAWSDREWMSHMQNTDPKPSADDLLQASSPPVARLKRTASSISKISNLGAAEDEEKRYKATRHRVSATAANHSASSTSLLPHAGTASQDVACKQEVPELDIKKEIDLTFSR
jgi:hypothetical protein